MTDALLVGLGSVGRRAARQLVDTPALDRVLLAARDHRHAKRVADALGPRAAAVLWTPGERLPAGVAVLACAEPSGPDERVVEAACTAGVACALVGGGHDEIDRLRGFDERARAAGVTVAVGCGLAPGLADVLARHAAGAFDEVDEIRVARSGWAGPACAAEVRRERRAPAREWHDGAWREVRPQGEELVWFPDPVAERDVQVVTGGVDLLVDAFPGVARISVRLGEPAQRRRFGRRRFGDDGEWGAARVEVWGRRGTARDVVVYGVIERTAVAAGAVLAVTAACLAGAGPVAAARPGVSGLAALVEPVPFLAELSDRGVRAAVFEGVPVG